MVKKFRELYFLAKAFTKMPAIDLEKLLADIKNGRLKLDNFRHLATAFPMAPDDLFPSGDKFYGAHEHPWEYDFINWASRVYKINADVLRPENRKKYMDNAGGEQECQERISRNKEKDKLLICLANKTSPVLKGMRYLLESSGKNIEKVTARYLEEKQSFERDGFELYDLYGKKIKNSGGDFRGYIFCDSAIPVLPVVVSDELPEKFRSINPTRYYVSSVKKSYGLKDHSGIGICANNKHAEVCIPSGYHLDGLSGGDITHFDEQFKRSKLREDEIENAIRTLHTFIPYSLPYDCSQLKSGDEE